jgi:hypothetical protein
VFTYDAWAKPLYGGEFSLSTGSMISMISAARWRMRNPAVCSETKTSSPAPAEVEGSRSASGLAVIIARPGRILSLNMRGIAAAS